MFMNAFILTLKLYNLVRDFKYYVVFVVSIMQPLKQHVDFTLCKSFYKLLPDDFLPSREASNTSPVLLTCNKWGT